MDFLKLYEERHTIDMNKELERISAAHFALKNRYYNCLDTVVANDKGLPLSEPLRHLLQNLEIDPLNIEINHENSYAVLYHYSGQMFKLNLSAGDNPTSISMYKDLYLDFNSLQELYSTY
ncbi:hypothetical protein [Paenibacillus sp. Y412MC10]|uniref:hypothetical protein n=1 Tax=Geobacillus sp. (strain Y412MC10) TaxID=481743 RepID=UPI0011AB8420|nr:hypothetical protein [Paenibacillus sp. Y412MC10]